MKGRKSLGYSGISYCPRMKQNPRPCVSHLYHYFFSYVLRFDEDDLSLAAGIVGGFCFFPVYADSESLWGVGKFDAVGTAEWLAFVCSLGRVDGDVGLSVLFLVFE